MRKTEILNILDTQFKRSKRIAEEKSKTSDYTSVIVATSEMMLIAELAINLLGNFDYWTYCMNNKITYGVLKND